MHKLLISSVLALSLCGGASAMAATKAAPKPQPTAASSKETDCAKQWKAQKKHTETHKAFMAACTKA